MTTATHDPELTARSYLESFATADPAVIAAHVSPDFVNEHTAGLGTGCRTRAVYEQRLSGFLADMEGLTYEVEQLVVDDRTGDVAAFYVMRASWQGDAPFEIRGAQRLTIVDGLITHRVDYWDSAVFLAQVDATAAATLATMGVTPPSTERD